MGGVGSVSLYDKFLDTCVMYASEEDADTHIHNFYCGYFAEALEDERQERLNRVVNSTDQKQSTGTALDLRRGEELS